MGILIDGEWNAKATALPAKDGHFLRPESSFRNWITPDGAPGPTGAGGFAAAPGRYHLYVALACPWAHRTLILRKLKGLESMISLSVVHWFMGDDGWTFQPGPGVIDDSVLGTIFLRDVYLAAKRDYTGRVTVPVLWDKATHTIVNNESSDIIRMFNSAFDALGAVPGDYYPAPLHHEIDELNARIYATVNNGVYRCGFAGSQAAYEEAAGLLFDTLEMLEARLATRRFLVGDAPTEADWRLFVTLVRFDAVYVGLFKCNLRRIADHPHLQNYLIDLYRWPGVADTVEMGHIKRHYYQSLKFINPTGVVPVGPKQSF